jgi:hypothetical protein
MGVEINKARKGNKATYIYHLVIHASSRGCSYQAVFDRDVNGFAGSVLGTFQNIVSRH